MNNNKLFEAEVRNVLRGCNDNIELYMDYAQDNANEGNFFGSDYFTESAFLKLMKPWKVLITMQIDFVKV